MERSNEISVYLPIVYDLYRMRVLLSEDLQKHEADKQSFPITENKTHSI